MKLSDGEKLIIHMLSKLYEKNNIEDDINTGLIESAIAYDQLWAINIEYPGIVGADVPEDVDKIIAILNMWQHIEDDYSKLTYEQKRQLEDKVPFDGKDPKFTGFHHKDEIEPLSIVKFLVKELGRFDNFNARKLDSYNLELDGYLRMLDVFQTFSKDMRHKALNVEQITDILKVKAGP